MQSNDLRDLFTLPKEGKAETTEIFDDIRSQMEKAEAEKEDNEGKGKEKLPDHEEAEAEPKVLAHEGFLAPRLTNAVPSER